MSKTKIFYLPDLGEGLPDAEVVEWHVKVGDVIRLDESLVSMETAKAVVEVPAPCSGKLINIGGDVGDVILTGALLAEFELDLSLPQRAEAQDTGHHHAPPKVEAAKNKAASESKPASPREDSGTVVGAMQSSDQIRSESAVNIGGIKAMPAVRAMAKKLSVDLSRVRGSGAGGVITIADVRSAADAGTAKASNAAPATARPTPATRASSPTPRVTSSDNKHAMNVDEPIRGVRRNMVRVMSQAHAEVVPTTLMDDADIHAWQPGEDITVRLLRSLVVAAQAVPALNSWLNAKEGTLRRHSRVDVGIAVDTDDGLFVPALRGCELLDAQQMRAEVNRIRDQVRARSIPPEDLRDYTIMLSNFGVFAGKYATPIVVPPCVAIIGAGRLFHEVVPVLGGVETHRIMPISITFDHRACTGGEAARFLRALLDDLQRAN